MEKNLKNKRMSLDPAKNPFSAIQRHHNATELDVRQSPHEESQISLSNNDHNPSKDLGAIFDAISKKTDRIQCDSLFSLLQEEGYGDNLYAAVEMIALVDHQGKGYVTRDQFVGYFSRNYDEESLPPLPAQMLNRQRWVQAIEENFEIMSQYKDMEYCYFVAEKMKQEIANKRKDIR